MAFKLTKELPNGSTALHHRVTNIRIDIEYKTAIIKVKSYLNKAAYTAGKPEMAEKTFRCDSTTYPFTANGQSINQAETYVMAQPYFAGALADV